MSYLIFASATEAASRSADAWDALGYPAGATQYLWAWRLHPTDGRAALVIPPTPADAQIDASQEAYDDLLSPGEQAALVGALPADWEWAEF